MLIENRDLSRLYHMLQYCARIRATLAQLDNTEGQFFAKESYAQRDAICFYLFQIGELARAVKDEFKVKHADIPWQAMRGLRNVVAHEYGEVDFKIIWETVVEDIPVLTNNLQQILESDVVGFAEKFQQEIKAEFTI